MRASESNKEKASDPRLNPGKRMWQRRRKIYPRRKQEKGKVRE
tara:strand:- start:76 stop:204 length:129 start_codon:yes stop_codon:yes gene_type:complete